MWYEILARCMLAKAEKSVSTNIKIRRREIAIASIPHRSMKFRMECEVASFLFPTILKIQLTYRKTNGMYIYKHNLEASGLAIQLNKCAESISARSPSKQDMPTSSQHIDTDSEL